MTVYFHTFRQRWYLQQTQLNHQDLSRQDFSIEHDDVHYVNTMLVGREMQTIECKRCYKSELFVIIKNINQWKHYLHIDMALIMVMIAIVFTVQCFQWSMIISAMDTISRLYDI